MKHFNWDSPVTWRQYRNLALISIPLGLLISFGTLYGEAIKDKVTEIWEARKK